VAILTSAFALAAYVVFALIARLGELHLYVSLAVVAVLSFSLYVIYSELSTKRFNKSV
jgi:membrane protein implicated in regulation of membrane protease activity